MLDGNSKGTYGTGPAVLDGGRVIDGWQRCGKAEEAWGNPLWNDIYYADIKLNIRENFDHAQVVLHRQVPLAALRPAPAAAAAARSRLGERLLRPLPFAS